MHVWSQDVILNEGFQTLEREWIIYENAPEMS